MAEKMQAITPEQWLELEAAAHNGGIAYPTDDPNDRATPILLELEQMGLMQFLDNRSGPSVLGRKMKITPLGETFLAAQDNEN